MRITFVMANGFSLAGGDRVIAIYAERLLRRGHTVAVISSKRNPPPLRRRLRAMITGKVWPFTKPNPNHDHFHGTQIPHRIKEEFGPVTAADLPDADAVVATWWETADWIQGIPAAKGAKVHFVQHYEAFEYLPKERVDAVLRLPFHKITISKWLVDLLRAFGDPAPDLIFNSVETEQFFAPPRTRNAAPRVGMLYSSMAWKGCDIALGAFEAAKKVFPDLELVTFGAHDRSIHPKLPLPDGTSYEYRPKQSRIPEIYASCDVWLCGSRGEGFHLPPLEAMACRTPVVSTAVGGPMDIIRDSVNGYLAPVGDSAALGEALIKVLRLSPAAWRKMSDAAHSTAVDYTWDDAADLFEQALTRAVREVEPNSGWMPRPHSAATLDWLPDRRR